VIEHAEFVPHRFLHESYRTACLLLIRGYVLDHTPSAVDIGLLVRQNLSLMETMYEQKLPGLGTIHWVLFITALNCIPAKVNAGERIRATKLYQALM
jgi:transcriptional activator protein UGA3